MRRLDAVLASVRVRALAVKGVALASSEYSPPWARPMADIDLLLGPSDVARVTAALATAGWQVLRDPARPLSSALLETLVVAPPPLSRIPVELHASLDKVVPRPIDIGALFARGRPFEEAEWVWIPGREDHLLLVALHLAADEFNHLPGFADLEVLLRPGLDMGAVVERAKAWRATTAVYLALRTLEALGGPHVAPELLTALEPSRLRRVLLSRVFQPSRWPVTGGAISLGVPWILRQTLIRDDRSNWLRGLARYAGIRVRERAEGAVVRARPRH